MSAWDEVVDVVIVGSGAAGLSAALSAQHCGVQTLVLERSDKIGGTSAVSGGTAWVPNNHRMSEIGHSDSREQALTYLRSLSLGAANMALAETFVDEGPGIFRFLEAETMVRFRSVRTPDYHPEHPGANVGRSISAELFPANELGELRAHLRSAPCFPLPITNMDVDDGVNILDPEIMGDRIARGLVGTGMALMAGLIKGAVDKGARIRRNVRVHRLVVERNVVVGVEAEESGRPLRIGARRAVILASGGFEWNGGLVRDLLSGPVDGALSPPFNEGDGLLMAMDVQAAVANTQEAWWMPMLRIPGEEYEGLQLNRLTVGERARPHSIMVNRAGKRFVNEAQNYNDVGRTLHNFDAMAFGFSNLPAWLIVDQDFLDKYPFGTRFPGDPIPAWLDSAPSLRELAGTIGVDADALEATVARFNEHASVGEDPDFGRGTSLYDLNYGDRSRNGGLQTLGPVARAPFYACRVYSGILGTKGGPKINEKAEVLSVRGNPIAGLYAAGNVCASFTGMAYPGAGATLGPGIVFGHIAGREAALRLGTA